MPANLHSVPSPLQRQAPLHALAWLAWVVASVVALSLTRNPIYLLLLLLCLGLVLGEARLSVAAPALPLSPLRFGLLVVAVSALFNALTAHFGQTVLLTLPGWLPLLGGPVTLEALVYGAINGLVLTGFFVAWTVLFVAVTTQSLIRLIPRALYPVGVVLSIALAFVPATFSQFQQIREAQLVRGHRVRGLRDWLPLVMPLLVGGLERALQLAEAMTARGFGSLGVAREAESDRTAASDRLRLSLVLGLAALLAGLLVLIFWQQEVAGWSLVLLGGAVLLLALVRQGRRIRRTVYRRQPWLRRDWLVLLSAGLVASVYALPAGRDSLAYSPYPQLTWPPVDLVVVLGTLALLTPAALLAVERRLQVRNLSTLATE